MQENDKLKDQLGAVAEELTTVKQQLDKDSEIQKQLQQLLAATSRNDGTAARANPQSARRV
ncbi:MAG: hypothetical protein U5L01_05785 [Rheinheimera sp.]|nr:hypothetical protein [Rheinheimera sp.]